MPVALPMRCPLHPSKAAARALAILLDRWARHAAIRAKHATVARSRLQPRAAAPTVVEELAGVGRHVLYGLVAADRTSES